MTFTLMPPPDSRMGSVAGQLPLLTRVTGRIAAALTATTPTRLDGADISHYQDDAGPIDWNVLRTATWWSATKATQGTGYVDPTFRAHWSQMAQGFTHRLAYHWLSPTVSPTAQAVHYLQTVGGFAPGMGAMLDAEQAGITAANVLEWCEAVEASTRRPSSVYTGAYVAGGTIWQSTAIRTSRYGPRPMHLAAYTTEAKALTLPGVKAYPFDAWQYSSNGPVPGVTGRCDMNRVDNGAAYDLACGVLAPPTPIPGDTDMADTYFSVETLPGEYLLRAGRDPVPFASAADRDALVIGMQLVSSGHISLEQYTRLFAPAPVVNVTVPPIVVPPYPTHIISTIS